MLQPDWNLKDVDLMFDEVNALQNRRILLQFVLADYRATTIRTRNPLEYYLSCSSIRLDQCPSMGLTPQFPLLLGRQDRNFPNWNPPVFTTTCSVFDPQIFKSAKVDPKCRLSTIFHQSSSCASPRTSASAESVLDHLLHSVITTTFLSVLTAGARLARQTFPGPASYSRKNCQTPSTPYASPRVAYMAPPFGTFTTEFISGIASQPSPPSNSPQARRRVIDFFVLPTPRT